jgi:predicted RNase H-like nuclease (RuvC/YqgF family)
MGEDRAPNGTQTEQTPEHHVRLKVAEAAGELGISAEAVRSRVRRGTLRSTKEGSTVYVLLPAPVEDASADSGNQSRPNTDRTAPGHDRTAPEHDRTGDKADARDELVEELRDRVRALEEANRENRRIIAGLIQRVPELEPPRDEPHGPETDAETSEDVAAPTDQVDRETGVQRRSWWRRFFGFE